MNRYPLNPAEWFMQEEKRKESQRNANDISLINRQLKDMLQRLQHKYVDHKNYSSFVHQLERTYRVSNCTLWDIGYINNFESKEVPLAQALLINHILKKETIEGQRYLQDEVDRLMRQLGNVDWAIYLNYGTLKSRM